MRIHSGWKETFKVIGAMVIVGLLVGLVVSCLTGCAGSSAGIKVEHHSSAQDLDDRCDDDLIGFDLRFPLGRNCGDYCPEMSMGLGWDFRGGACQGRSPVGEAQFRTPVWVRK
jgi:hypothetical protein